jgi:hypothetical protein
VAVTGSDIKFKLSVKTGSAGNSTSSTPAASLGKYVSTTEITDASVSNVFDTISGDENAASDVEYRCFFVHNSSAQTWFGVKAWLSSETSGGADAAIGLDTTAASAVGASSAQAVEVTDEQTAPSGVSFSAPTTKGAGLSVGDLTAGQVKAIWVRRTATNSAAIDIDGVVIRVEGDTAA